MGRKLGAVVAGAIVAFVLIGLVQLIAAKFFYPLPEGRGGIRMKSILSKTDDTPRLAEALGRAHVCVGIC